MKKIRWGMIGCGDVTEVKSGPAFQKAEGSELAAVMRRNGALAEDYARRHGVSRWYDDAEALLDDDSVDAVYVATPPSTHKEYTIAAARAGKPVYVEKPMARTHAECVAMIKACETEGVPLFVAYYRRALPRFLKVRSLLESGCIGEVRSVIVAFQQRPSVRDLEGRSHWRVDPVIAGCGYFCDLGSHMIDLLQFFLGPIVSAQGRTSNQGRLYTAEDTVGAVFRFESGVLGTGLWGFHAAEDVDRTEIIGTLGSITYPTFAADPIRLRVDGTVSEFRIEHPPHIQQPLIQSIVNELLGSGTCPSTGRTGAETNRVMDSVLGRMPD